MQATVAGLGGLCLKDTGCPGACGPGTAPPVSSPGNCRQGPVPLPSIARTRSPPPQQRTTRPFPCETEEHLHYHEVHPNPRGRGSQFPLPAQPTASNPPFLSLFPPGPNYCLFLRCQDRISWWCGSTGHFQRECVPTEVWAGHLGQCTTGLLSGQMPDVQNIGMDARGRVPGSTGYRLFAIHDSPEPGLTQGFDFIVGGTWMCTWGYTQQFGVDRSFAGGDASLPIVWWGASPSG